MKNLKKILMDDKYKDTINNINEQNDDYLKKIEEQNGALEKLKEEVKNNKKRTKDILIDSGEKINKFFQERLKYLNELKYELEKNS